VQSLRILIDADHCPARVREILVKTAVKRQIRLLFVSAKPLPVRETAIITCLLVPPGEQAADKKIKELVTSEDLVITADIPLAAQLVQLGVIVIHPRGDVFTRETIGERLAGYQLAQQLRDQGIDTSQYKAPARYQQQDHFKLFADALDRELTKRKKNIESKG
jgi:uncharacterized protein YaiI (UPF0178 family)